MSESERGDSMQEQIWSFENADKYTRKFGGHGNAKHYEIGLQSVAPVCYHWPDILAVHGPLNIMTMLTWDPSCEAREWKRNSLPIDFP